MITTAKDIFYLAVSGGFIILVIFLCVMIVQLIFILRDVNKITDKTQNIVDQVNHYILKPVKLVNRLVENINPIIEMIEKKIHEHQKKKKG